MWVITGILAAAAVIMMIEIPSLIKRKLRKELWVFTILLIIGTGLSIAQGLHWPIPSPLDLVIAVYKPISNIIYGHLK
ncbi:hypothetical protein [Paenibacillus azoreducens]|uniref:Uncharacterized protein n=1 Tax=Paenibacillus azoreducens TaxID=116718 RepID=A0A919YAY8_9BACL|nr:hypothetical protein [Paenibacillus azoreducens]GIO45510.1 hypothetical protein J34TS1_02750 [Paenibacillus azoreducens]